MHTVLLGCNYPINTLHNVTIIWTAANTATACRSATAEKIVERLYGEMQSYESLLPDTGFWAESLHLWETDGSDTSLASWKEIAVFPLLKSE